MNTFYACPICGATREPNARTCPSAECRAAYERPGEVVTVTARKKPPASSRVNNRQRGPSDRASPRFGR